MLAFVSMTHSITSFPAPFLTAIETIPCDILLIHFFLSIGRSFLQDRGKHPNLPERRAPYVASDHRPLKQLYLSKHQLNQRFLRMRQSVIVSKIHRHDRKVPVASHSHSRGR